MQYNMTIKSTVMSFPMNANQRNCNGFIEYFDLDSPYGVKKLDFDLSCKEEGKTYADDLDLILRQQGKKIPNEGISNLVMIFETVANKLKETGILSNNVVVTAITFYRNPDLNVQQQCVRVYHNGQYQNKANAYFITVTAMANTIFHNRAHTKKKDTPTPYGLNRQIEPIVIPVSEEDLDVDNSNNFDFEDSIPSETTFDSRSNKHKEAYDVEG